MVRYCALSISGRFFKKDCKSILDHLDDYPVTQPGHFVLVSKVCMGCFCSQWDQGKAIDILLQSRLKIKHGVQIESSDGSPLTVIPVSKAWCGWPLIFIAVKDGAKSQLCKSQVQ